MLCDFRTVFYVASVDSNFPRPTFSFLPFLRKSENIVALTTGYFTAMGGVRHHTLRKAT